MNETDLNQMKQELKTLQRESRPVLVPMGIFLIGFAVTVTFIGLPIWAVMGGCVLQVVLVALAYPKLNALSGLRKKIAAMEAKET